MATRGAGGRTAAVQLAEPETRDIRSFRASLRQGGQGPNAHVLLLGLHVLDTPELLGAIEKGFAYQAFLSFQRNTALPVESVMILMNIPRRTLTRRKQEGRFTRDESDRLVRASRVFGKALELFEGSVDGASNWLRTPQRGLGGATPLALSQTDAGSREVERLLGRLQHGVFA